MKKKRINIKEIDYRHWISIGVTLGFIACALLLFPYAFGRIWESIVSLIESMIYYFCAIFDIKADIHLTVNELSKIPFKMPFNLPSTWTEFELAWARFSEVLFTEENWQNYLEFLSDALLIASQVVVMLLPFILLLYVLFQLYLEEENVEHGKQTPALIAFKKWTYKYVRPVKAWIKGYIDFLKERKKYLIIWSVTWAYAFNLFSIALSFLAFYFYFVVEFNLISLYTQVYKLLFDLSPMIDFIPVVVWVIVAYYVLHRIRTYIGYQRLQHMEMRNRGFINERPIVSMICGSMGKKKTTSLTDMAMSQEAMLRDKAFEKILENDMKFPYFPWINLENAVKKAMSNHTVYNLATVRKFAQSKRRKFYKKPCMKNLFGYNYERYGYEYNDDLRIVDVWEVIETYAQLYFIYIIQSSLMIGNYSIRTDGELHDVGNFPMWDSDFFRKDTRYQEALSRHSHILDFDSLRLGRKVIEHNKNADNFEFGVVVITEIGKERGNTLELADKKKKDETTNQKNDLFNSWLKMVRHSATVDNFPFVKVFTDEQRPESWGADARDLCEIINIRETSETELAMPFFELEDLLYDLTFGKFQDVYYEYRYNRGDTSLPMYLIKSVISFFYDMHTRIHNRFGYCKLHCDVERGTQDAEAESKVYYIMSKKIYSKRFSTDCFSDFFNEKALRSTVGIDDLDEYASEKASFEELKRQNSYFINDLLQKKENLQKEGTSESSGSGEYTIVV